MKLLRRTMLLAALVAVGCITVNINFPAKEVDRAAEVIVGEARPDASTDGGDGSVSPAPTPGEGASSPGTPTIPPAPPAPSAETKEGAPAGGGEGTGAAAGLGGFPAWALAAAAVAAPAGEEGDIRININTPTIKAIRESLTKRFEKLKVFYDKGAIGENREGYIEARDDEGLSLAQKRDREALVKAENSDRRNLYREIVKENKFGEDRLKDVQKIFAQQWAEKSRVGWWIQKEDGKWEKKAPPPKKK